MGRPGDQSADDDDTRQSAQCLAMQSANDDHGYAPGSIRLAAAEAAITGGPAAAETFGR